jgi:hypothetical protein
MRIDLRNKHFRKDLIMAMKDAGLYSRKTSNFDINNYLPALIKDAKTNVYIHGGSDE